MKKTSKKPEKKAETVDSKSTRNIGVYLDDFRDFSKAANATERSRARMFRWVVSEWRAGRAVFAPIERPTAQFKRQAMSFAVPQKAA